jgi:hypothetical protein
LNQADSLALNDSWTVNCWEQGMSMRWLKYAVAGIGLGLAARAIHDQKSGTPAPASEVAPATPKELGMVQGK